MSRLPTIPTFGSSSFRPRSIGGPVVQTSSTPNPGGMERGPTGFDRLRGTLEDEISQQQTLADQQYGRLGGINTTFADEIGRQIGASTDLASRNAGTLRDQAGTVVSSTRSRVAEQERDFRNTVAQNVQGLTAGTNRAVENEISRVSSDPNLPDTVRKGQIRRLKSDRFRSMTEALSTASARYEEGRANLKAQGTQQILAAEQEAGRLIGAAAQVELAGQQFVQQYTSMYPTLAQMTAANPPPFVSRLAGLLTLSELSMAAGTSAAGFNAINEVFGDSASSSGPTNRRLTSRRASTFGRPWLRENA